MAIDVPIPESEFVNRRAQLTQELVSRGLDAALIWSRGGATSVDSHVNVMYLANHFSFFPLIQETTHWSGRGSSGLVLRADGATVLVTDVAAEDGSVYVDEAILAARKAEGLTEALQRLDLLDKKIGLVGRDTFLQSDYTALCAAAGRTFEFEAIDSALEAIRAVKSAGELELIRKATAVYCEAMEAMLAAAEPGRTDGQVVGEGLRVIASHGGRPYDIAIASGPSAGLYCENTMPTWSSERPLEIGDLIHIDAWGPVHGYCADMMRTTVVGGRPDEDQERTMNWSIGQIEHITEGIRPGATFADLYVRGVDYMRDSKDVLDIDWEADDDDGLFPAFGHSVGLATEGPWITPTETTELVEGMVLALESTGALAEGKAGAAHEDMVIVTANGHDVVTSSLPARPWLA